MGLHEITWGNMQMKRGDWSPEALYVVVKKQRRKGLRKKTRSRKEADKQRKRTNDVNPVTVT